MTFILIWLSFAIVTAIAAQARNHPVALWFLIGLLGGVFALIAVLVMRPGEAPADTASRPIGIGAVSSDGIAEQYRGITIRRNGDFFSVDGVMYGDIETARRAVDHAKGA